MVRVSLRVEWLMIPRTSASRMVRWEARLSWTVFPTVLSCRAVSRVLVLVPVGREGVTVEEGAHDMGL